MNREDIIRMARVAGVLDDEHRFEFSEYKDLEFFAILVAFAERKACAKVCEQYGFDNHCGTTTDVIATAIRARG